MDIIFVMISLTVSILVLYYMFKQELNRKRFYDKMRLYEIYLNYLDVCYHKGTHDFADFVEFQEYFYELEYKGIFPFGKK